MEQVLLAILHFGEDVSQAFGNLLGLLVVAALIFIYFKYLRNTTKIVILRNGEESTPKVAGNPGDNGSHSSSKVVSAANTPLPMEYQAALCKKQWEECSGKFTAIQESLKIATIENKNMMSYVTDTHTKVTKLSDKTRIALTYLAEKPVDSETARMIRVILNDDRE